MSAANSELLTQAMERQSPAIISAGDGPARREVMIQFTSTRQESNSPGFWARIHEGDGKVIDQLIKSANPVGVSFNTDSARINFQTSLLKKRRHNLMQKLLLLRWPDAIQVVEQRQKPRKWIPDRYRLIAKVEVISPGGNVVGESPIRVWDIGLEGASIICPNKPFILSLTKEGSVKITLRPPDSEKDFTILATHRYLTHLSDEKLRLGVQFAPFNDPSSAAAQRGLKALVEELDAVTGRHDMLGALRLGKTRKPDVKPPPPPPGVLE
jgi:hypothetical protein